MAYVQNIYDSYPIKDFDKNRQINLTHESGKKERESIKNLAYFTHKSKSQRLKS